MQSKAAVTEIKGCFIDAAEIEDWEGVVACESKFEEKIRLEYSGGGHKGTSRKLIGSGDSEDYIFETANYLTGRYKMAAIWGRRRSFFLGSFVGRKEDQGKAMCNVGVHCRFNGDLAGAHESFQEVRVLGKRVGSATLEFEACQALCLLALEGGRVEDADKLLQCAAVAVTFTENTAPESARLRMEIACKRLDAELGRGAHGEDVAVLIGRYRALGEEESHGLGQTRPARELDESEEGHVHWVDVLGEMFRDSVRLAGGNEVGRARKGKMEGDVERKPGVALEGGGQSGAPLSERQAALQHWTDMMFKLMQRDPGTTGAQENAQLEASERQLDKVMDMLGGPLGFDGIPPCMFEMSDLFLRSLQGTYSGHGWKYARAAQIGKLRVALLATLDTLDGPGVYLEDQAKVMCDIGVFLRCGRDTPRALVWLRRARVLGVQLGSSTVEFEACQALCLLAVEEGRVEEAEVCRFRNYKP